jgi:hypothetical protein
VQYDPEGTRKETLTGLSSWAVERARATWTDDRLDDLSKRVDDTVLATLATVIAHT